MRLNVFGSQPHYMEHIRPIFESLEPDFQGLVFKPSSLPRDYTRTSHRPPTIVASGIDAQSLRGCELVYVEHGAGQSYGGDESSRFSMSYSGGDGLDHVRLFVCPNDDVAKRWSKRYPAAKTVVVGCPRLDEFIVEPRKPLPERPLLGWSFHWNCRLVPETMSARSHWSPFMPMLTQLVAQLGFDQVMTTHPKSLREGEIMAHRLGLGFTADSTTFFRDVDVLVCDNSSLMYEMAALGRRIVALNAPWYRREVTHGLRFWSHIPGPDVDDVDTLARTLQRIADRDSIMLDCGRLAARAARVAYGVLDGSSSTRAADAIMALYDD